MTMTVPDQFLCDVGHLNDCFNCDLFVEMCWLCKGRNYAVIDLESSLKATQELPQESELKTLIQIWCLLISSVQWSRELKDVSNEVIRHIAEIIHSQVDPNNIQLSAVRIVRTAVTLVTMVTVDSQNQHMLPASIKLISLLVKILLGEDNYSVNTRVMLAKVTYVLIKICEGILTRYVFFYKIQSIFSLMNISLSSLPS